MIPQSKQMEEDNTDDFLNPLNVCESEDEGEEETINQSSTLSPDTSANGRKSSTNCVVNDPPLETMRLPEDQDKDNSRQPINQQSQSENFGVIKNYESISSQTPLINRRYSINQSSVINQPSIFNQPTLIKNSQSSIEPLESTSSYEDANDSVFLDATSDTRTRDANQIDAEIRTLITTQRKMKEKLVSSADHSSKSSTLSSTASKLKSASTPRSASLTKVSSGWNFREFYAEILGTFILMVLNNGIVATYTLRKKGPLDVLAQSYIAGIGAMMGIIVSLPVSGGHINPAVSIAFAFFQRGGFNWSKVPHYVLGQFLGSFLAQLFLYVNFYDAINDFDGGFRSAYGTNTSTGGIFATFPGDHNPSVFTCIFDQIFGTSLLLMGVCGITDEYGINLPMYLQPFFISLLVAALASGMGLNAGAILNPARDLSPRIFLSLFGYGWEPFEPTGGHYWYAVGVIGPILGAIVGVFVYNFVIGSYLVEKRVGEEMRKKLLDKEESESKDDETSLNGFNEDEISAFKSPEHTMVNMGTNQKHHQKESNLFHNQNNLDNSSTNRSNQRSKSVCYGQQSKKRHSILGAMKEYVD